jgi:probable H4MPT-linked C1 transfer pathway protein
MGLAPIEVQSSKWVTAYTIGACPSLRCVHLIRWTGSDRTSIFRMSDNVRVLGLDIGGANIKAATADGVSVCVPFEIWRRRDELETALRALKLPGLEQSPDVVALVMTAELADCFETKAEGVDFIIRTVQTVFDKSLIRVWLTSGEFADPEDALDFPMLVAASNWHAMATWAGRAIPVGPALLIDVGSTTTDVIPLMDGVPVPQGLTDLERLASRELIYTGIWRTPVCAVVSEVPFPADVVSSDMELDQSTRIPVAAEHFATMLDVHLLNGDLPEAPQRHDTADGRPATRACAASRLAHMLCCDLTELTAQQLSAMAKFIAEQQAMMIRRAVQSRLDSLSRLVPSSRIKPALPAVLVCGSGSWLAEQVLEQVGMSRFSSISNLSSMFVRNVSDCAPAFAVARLAAERCTDDLLPLTSL